MEDQVEVKKSFDVRHLTDQVDEDCDDKLQPQRVETVTEPASNAQLRFSIAHIMGFMGQNDLKVGFKFEQNQRPANYFNGIFSLFRMKL